MDIYELLNKIIINKRFELSSDLFTQADKDVLSESDVPLFNLLKNISSLGSNIYNFGIVFYPMFVMTDGSRTFSVEDITDDDYKTLKSIDFQRTPLILRALIADILWTQKREYQASKIAAEAYWELAQLWGANNSNVDALDMIKRAVCISTQTNQKVLYSEICTWLNSYLNCNIANDNGFFLLRIMDLFAEIKDYDVSTFLPVLDNIISTNDNNLLEVEQAYALKTKCLYKLKKIQTQQSTILPSQIIMFILQKRAYRRIFRVSWEL